MIKLEEWVDIVALHRSGVAIQAIARTVGISRNAVRRALRRQALRSADHEPGPASSIPPRTTRWPGWRSSHS